MKTYLVHFCVNLRDGKCLHSRRFMTSSLVTTEQITQWEKEIAIDAEVKHSQVSVLNFTLIPQ